MNTIKGKINMSFIILLLSGPLLANDYFAKIVNLRGNVEIFYNPSSTITENDNKILYEGTYYQRKIAKVADVLEEGNIIRTAGKSLVRLIYPNGDQINLGPGSEIKVSSQEGGKNSKKPIVDLMFGQFRAVVDKEGPRNNLEVRTKVASMGVRGTDFFVNRQGHATETQLTVIRGSVALKLNHQKSPPVEVTKGFTAQIMTEQKVEEVKNKIAQQPLLNVEDGTNSEGNQRLPATDKTANKWNNIVEESIILAPTHKGQLIQVQQASVISLPPDQKGTEAKDQLIPVAVANELKELENKATQSTLKEIKADDPALYEKLAKSDNVVAAINTEVVKQAFDKAPKPSLKPNEKLLYSDDEDVYDKYFKESW